MNNRVSQYKKTISSFLDGLVEDLNLSEEEVRDVLQHTAIKARTYLFPSSKNSTSRVTQQEEPSTKDLNNKIPVLSLPSLEDLANNEVNDVKVKRTNKKVSVADAKPKAPVKSTRSTESPGAARASSSSRDKSSVSVKRPVEERATTSKESGKPAPISREVRPTIKQKEKVGSAVEAKATRSSSASVATTTKKSAAKSAENGAGKRPNIAAGKKLPR